MYTGKSVSQLVLLLLFPFCIVLEIKECGIEEMLKALLTAFV